MSPRASSSSSGTGTESGTSRFTFVTGSIQSEARSHAMREHWKRRHKRNQEVKTLNRKKASSSLTLLPRVPSSSNEGFTTSSSPATQLDGDRGGDGVSEEKGVKQRQQAGIPAQILSGMSHALSSSRPDPFQTCPVHLTSQHQKLLYHWISTHAAMMFEDLDVTEFNPMKDVWFPLDLSNASSFNCILAHSAAHLSNLYAGTPPRRGTISSDALQYKIEAVRILRLWLGDPDKELSDDAFAAVVRLLTFERYWGTVEDWKIHRDGLQRMIDARGGVGTLHDNWRLELVVYLVSLMSRPSWLESTNKLERISRPVLSSTIVQRAPSLDVQKLRCLWLISFIQDMRTFMGSFYSRGLLGYPTAHTAVALLFQNFQTSTETCPPDGDNIMDWEHELLGCLFSISVLIQESISVVSDGGPTTPTQLSTLDELEIFLRDSRHIWMGSVHNLRIILFESLSRLFEQGDSKVGYVLDLVQVLSTLSLEARQGVERCLLNLLYCLGNTSTTLLIDDRWTPDSLLSSMHGH
ncbi:hypothetical protein ASPBRDRAFT_137943 [Aspergillus brasiliensis CBS 101740]|uniref:Tachykinin family protein n=1 Tax=Aspergillus brasiliensis (strain CBS 101740 / IMI 381727 / IBT 21946) TaxID=767769 RepID=A0A1L9U478_ASPBC|nr:hypothetical protein ASPBRDRAFT_137943 [Aspergillus brasiliensis CBS 101740]